MELFFENPSFLILLIVIPITILFHFLGFLNLKKKTFKFANYETLLRINKTRVILSKNVSQLIFRIIFLVILIFAIAELNLVIDSTGFNDNIVFGIDVSGSMLADDITPNRLISAKNNLVTIFENKSIYSQVGLFAFTSLNYPVLPITDDKLTIISKIKTLKVEDSTGTSLGNALTYASALFKESDLTRENIIVLITDGQENILSEEELIRVIDFVNSQGIKIYVIGLGSSSGGKITTNTTGLSVVNEESLKLFGEDNYIIVDSDEKLNEALNSLLIEKAHQRIIELNKYLYVICFILLIFEWYLINSVFRSFP
jgi:Ca-activated chloride channel homolog